MSCVLVALSVQAQKKPLNHSVYDSWQRITDEKLTNDGKFAVYAITPQDGDGMLVITNLKTKVATQIPRGYWTTPASGSQLSLSYDSQLAVSIIKPLFSQVRDAKIKKKKPEDMPKDSLAIITLSNGSVEKIPYVKTFKVPEKAANALAYLLDPPADTSKKKGVLKKEKEEGTPLVIRQLATKKQDTIRYVTDFVFSKNGQLLVANINPNSKDSLAKAGVVLYNTATGAQKMISNGKGRFKGFCFDDNSAQLAYVAERDSAKADPKIYKLYYYTSPMDTASVLVEQGTAGMPANWAVSENGKLGFSKNGQRLFFGTAPIPEPKDTTLYDFEIAKLDVWHYADDFIQPMQLKGLDKELKRSYLAVIQLSDKSKVLQLANTDLPNISTTKDGEEAYAVGADDKKYRIELQWEGDLRNDLYVVSLTTGERKPVTKGLQGNFGLSPQGKFISWYDEKERQYYAYSVATGATVCLTKNIPVNFWNEKNDTPSDPNAYGAAGWLEGDIAILLYDQYDIWQVDPTGNVAPVNITNGVGRDGKLTFRYIKTDPEAQAIGEKEMLLLSVFDNVSKKGGFYTKDMSKPKAVPVVRVLDGYSFSRPVKAQSSNTFVFTKGNFTTTPNLYATGDWWKTTQQLSDINLQQKDYNWGTAELMNYKTFDGIDAQAILYKPENFDPNKKYPVLMYFYEKHTDDLHRYMQPAPSASTINIPFFCSRGYIVLSPDIYYTDGHPGKSAYNSIVAAAEELCKNSWADKANMGIQGQSWGGYEVAYLVTQTNMFKAAGAGAPVSNMTSAYGGIRWESGMVRQFQYEHQQSRIGKDLWAGFDLYKENSPLFFADKVETPLLIMHNDNDGAVPWYQGIEYFTALRRLGKQVWMLQYNGEAHNLMERRNRKDLSIRLQQFFDYHLKGDKPAEWIVSGVPATKKGKDWGLNVE